MRDARRRLHGTAPVLVLAVLAVEAEGSERAERARRVSPLSYVRRDVPPVLVIHSEHDGVVPYSHSTRLRDAMHRAGARVERIHGYGRVTTPNLDRLARDGVWFTFARSHASWTFPSVAFPLRRVEAGAAVTARVRGHSR